MPIRSIVTARQLAILDELAKDARPGPSYEELARAVGLKSIGAVAYQVRRLLRMGLIKYIPKKARSLDLTSHGRSTIEHAKKENSYAENIRRN